MHFSLAAPQSIPVDYSKFISAGWTDWFQTPLLYFCRVFNYPWSSSVHNWVIVCVWGSSQLNNGPVKKYSVFWAHFLFRLLVCHWKVAKSEQSGEQHYLPFFFFTCFWVVVEQNIGHIIILSWNLFWLGLILRQGLKYLWLTSTPYAAKDDFELLASNFPVVGCMHPCLVVYNSGSCTQGFMHTEQASTILSKLHLQSHELVLCLLFFPKYKIKKIYHIIRHFSGT